MRALIIPKPKSSAPVDTHSLLREIERKDAFFRATQTLFFAVISIFLILLLFVNINVENKNQQTLDGQAKELSAISAASKQRTSQISDLQKHIDCITLYFSTANRTTSTTITDPNNCSINNPASALGGSTGSTKSSN